MALGIPLADAVRMLTVNPATLLGIEFKKGALRTGADADIVLLDEDLQRNECVGTRRAAELEEVRLALDGDSCDD